ncbi:DUF1501 domain-containing protein [Tabrizicola sp.]|uniref:DUF1501 domain-containing protein n=1 Tax=Tabrizicola sp. TaxID=2005166 RepID=UPI00286CEA89|nr:DUF1501 domain-containing protein [Tabrizicola sp.]
MERRFFLRSLGMLGCSAAAHPWLTTLTMAQGTPAMGDNRLVVIILRGAMDGLDVVQPRGDAGFLAARPGISAPATDLDGFFALNDALSDLMPLWQAGELGVVHATSTPYRDKRSHFDGQDLLEAGTGIDVAPGAGRDGWLNRLLQAVPGITSETAYAVGREALPILGGAAEVRNWAPDQKLVLSGPGRLLLDHVYHDDPLFRDTVEEAFALTAGGDPMVSGRAEDVDMIVDFVAERLRGDTRIAAFSQSGWDTHKAQARAIKQPLARLQRTILRMKAQLGPEVWGKTTLLAMTEFGRTVRENGTGGTDHGTGGVMLVAGGAVRGGRVMGRWPGLAEAGLYDRRDLMPTSDVRAWAAHAMRGLYGLDRGVLESTVFPGLEMGDDPGFLL